MNIRTVEGDAKENEDFLKLDEQIEFTDDCLDKQEIEITIVNSKEFQMKNSTLNYTTQLLEKDLKGKTQEQLLL